ncbi:hypothetical protein NDI47_08155 [Microcoleus vaginatus GB1-A2]|uniref:hypothetical protein n=1 Tax=Microcoleus vaginatus TaxID=119532 RepID=UPI001689A772|nr:hypothetical protein [Microcoleus sp. FACHB-61]
MKISLIKTYLFILIELIARLKADSEAYEADLHWDYPPDSPEKNEEEIETYEPIRLG